MRELNTKSDYYTNFSENSKDGFSKNRLKAFFHLPKSNLSHGISNDHIPSRYVFSYELDNDNNHEVKNIKYVKANHVKECNSLFDFSPAFEFSQNKSVINGEYDSDYKTIFTYSDPVNKKYDEMNYEIIDHTNQKSMSHEIHNIFQAFSVILLIVLFPFLCWFYVKYLPRNKRAIIFRLGRRMKPKGPGWVILLPICDQFHIVSIDDQTVKIQPVSAKDQGGILLKRVLRIQGGTQDEAIIELDCSVIYHLLDAEYAFNTTTKSPKELVSSQAQLCLLSALSNLKWSYLEQGGANVDLATETKGNLNSRCSAYGIQITNVEIGKINLLRSPPQNSQKVDVSKVSKQIQQLSYLFLNNYNQNLHANSNESSESWNKVNENIDQSLTKENAEFPVNDSRNEEKVTNQTSENFSKQTSFLSSNHSIFPKLSINHRAFLAAISRAQKLLKSEIACQALEHASLQLIISQTNLNKHDLPIPEQANSQGFVPIYLDAGSGKAGLGLIRNGKQADVVLYVCITDLMDIIEGRLDVLDAVDKEKSFMIGSRPILSKMRHLLYLPPSSGQ